MKFQHLNGAPLEAKVDLLAIAVHSDPGEDSLVKAADRALDGLVAQQMKDEQFTAKQGQCVVMATRGDLAPRYVAFVGAGDKDRFELARVRDLAGLAMRVGRRVGAGSVGFVPPKTNAKTLDRALQLAAEGAALGTYRFDRYKGENSKNKSKVKTFRIASERRVSGKKSSGAPKGARGAMQRAEAIARAVCHARDLINEPAAVMTPAKMAAEARALAKKHGRLQAKILGPKECEKLGMGMLLAVGRGSHEEPRLIHLTYKPETKAKKRIALVGKGITFDSGGYSLKPSAGMEDMKADMSGAAAVIAAMGALADLGCKYEVHAVAPCAENLVSGNAYKLGDVLEAMDGTTVEINNTDAEGRLALGDAIAYVREKVKPDEMFDFATLTGACVIALGPYTAAVMSDHDDLISRWMAAAEGAGEDVWRMPLTPRLRDQLKSSIADMRNTGERYGGAITAGLFLKHFVRDTPWVHNDIAGPATSGRDGNTAQKGGTGFGVATILEYLSR